MFGALCDTLGSSCLEDRRTQRFRDLSSEERRNGIANLFLDLPLISHKLKLVRKRLKPLQFRNAKTAIIPMKWSNVRTRLRLDR